MPTYKLEDNKLVVEETQIVAKHYDLDSIRLKKKEAEDQLAMYTLLETQALAVGTKTQAEYNTSIQEGSIDPVTGEPVK